VLTEAGPDTHRDLDRVLVVDDDTFMAGCHEWRPIHC
jgi:hypothetical protein